MSGQDPPRRDAFSPCVRERTSRTAGPVARSYGLPYGIHRMSPFRLARIYLRRNDAPTHHAFDEVRCDFRVGLADIDLNLHLNNAKYLRYMDLARLEHLVATGLLYRFIRSRHNPIVAATEIAYVRELRTFQPFTVSARMIGYDERFLYYEQRFVSDGKLCTHAFLRLACVRGGKGRPTSDLREAVGLPDSPALPEPIVRWRAMLEAKRAYARSG